MTDIKIILQSRGLKISTKRSKNDYLVLCPFHEDTNASCSVNKDKGFFKCWSCGEKGSIAKLVAKLDRVSEKDAWKILNGFEDTGKTVRIKNTEKPIKFEIDELVEKYYLVKELMMLLISRKDLRLAKELDKELRNEKIWDKFREKQKHLKKNWEFKDTVNEAKFNYITDYIECYHKDKLYIYFTKFIQEYNFKAEFSLVLELLENQKYKNYIENKNIFKEIEYKLYLNIKDQLQKELDTIF